MIFLCTVSHVGLAQASKSRRLRCPKKMEDWEVTGEEEENRIDKKRNGLGKDTARYTKNVAIVKSQSRLEVDRLLVHKECTEEYDDDTDNSKHFADGSNKQRDSVNLVVFMVCGSQIDKLLSEDERFKGAEDFSSLVLRSTVYQTNIRVRALASERPSHRVFEAGRGMSVLGDSNQLAKFFTDCGENIKEFERDMFIAFDLDEDETAYCRKKELVFRRFETLISD